MNMLVKYLVIRIFVVYKHGFIMLNMTPFSLFNEKNIVYVNTSTYLGSFM